MLEIKNLHVEVDKTEIIKGISLEFHKGKVHALMGPNGSGKSTLAKTLMGHPKYKITKGQILLDGKDITHMKPHLRAQLGLFLSFQYPKEITGVNYNTFLRAAYNNTHKEKLSLLDFHKLLKEKMKELNMDPSFSKRAINQGFSGGEKKRAEILQMSLLEPKYAMLDETDSGTDVDALKVISENINKDIVSNKMGIILITHYNRILEYIIPDKVTVIVKGKLVDSGNADLARNIESNGFKKYLQKENSLSDLQKENGINNPIPHEIKT